MKQVIISYVKEVAADPLREGDLSNLAGLPDLPPPLKHFSSSSSSSSKSIYYEDHRTDLQKL